MRPSKAEVLERERRWSLPAAISTFAGVALLIAWQAVFRAVIGGGTNYEGLESIHENSSAFVLSGVLEAIGFTLLLAPLLFLFRAVEARSERVKSSLVGLVVIAPLCIGISGVLLSVGANQAATNYVHGNVKGTLTPAKAAKECKEEETEKGGKAFGEEFEATKGRSSLQVCQNKNLQEDRASNAAEESSLLGVAQIVSLIGGLAFIVGLFYTSLWAMRSGLLTRFWGSLGMAVGFLTLFTLTPLVVIWLIWFIYLGLLVAGRVPGGRPPAWAAGESIPWPSPGERAAASLSGPGASEEEPPPGGGEEVPPGGGEGETRRKRKQRT